MRGSDSTCFERGRWKMAKIARTPEKLTSGHLETKSNISATSKHSCFSGYVSFASSARQNSSWAWVPVLLSKSSWLLYLFAHERDQSRGNLCSCLGLWERQDILIHNQVPAQSSKATPAMSSFTSEHTKIASKHTRILEDSGTKLKNWSKIGCRTTESSFVCPGGNNKSVFRKIYEGVAIDKQF